MRMEPVMMKTMGPALAKKLSSQKILPEDIERVIVEDMAKAIFRSNKIERLGLSLDETY